MTEEREPTTRDLAGAEPELIAAAALDVTDCERLEMSMGLFEHEKAGHRFESWPPVIQQKMETLLADFFVRKPDRAIRCITTAVAKKCCVMIVHHGQKK